MNFQLNPISSSNKDKDKDLLTNDGASMKCEEKKEEDDDEEEAITNSNLIKMVKALDVMAREEKKSRNHLPAVQLQLRAMLSPFVLVYVHHRRQQQQQPSISSNVNGTVLAEATENSANNNNNEELLQAIQVKEKHFNIIKLL